MSSSEDPSLELIRSSEYYPKRQLVVDDTRMELPFPCLCGESPLFLGKTAEGTIAVSNFRLVVCYKDSFVNIPLGLVEMIECRDIFYLHIYCKDSRIVRCTFATNEACLEWYKRLSNALTVPKRLDDVFAFAFLAWCQESDPNDTGNQVFGDAVGYTFGNEVERMGFNLKTAWRITYINENYKFCPTYPKLHIVPKSIKDEDLQSAASFRTSRRIPSVVWRDRTNGAILARCSQPEVGWLGWRNTEDEKLIQELATACAMDRDQQREHTANGHVVSNGEATDYLHVRKVLILDARSYTAAVANRAKGGGCECPEYYPNCDIQFMNLANIHSVRKSFQALRTLCAGVPDQPNWCSFLENSRWLAHVSGLMKSALIAVNAIDKDGMPVVVHCSDGWDRTPQIVALAELMLDPYYRTFEGFQALVEREWLDFGHKFADRCGQGIHCDDGNERCPVFLQFLDCVYQLIVQFPCAFQYNESFLVKLVQHTYSCLFGTFLCNSASERDEARLRKKTVSVWSLLKHDNWKLKNYLYSPGPTQVLRPQCYVRSLRLWSSVFLANTAPLSDGPADDMHIDSQDLPVLAKTRSCDDIVATLEHTSNNINRTSSDPNLASEQIHDTKFLKDMETVDKRLEVSMTQDIIVRFDNIASSTEDLKDSADENSATESDLETIDTGPEDKELVNGIAHAEVNELNEEINGNHVVDDLVFNDDVTTTTTSTSTTNDHVINGHFYGETSDDSDNDSEPTMNGHAVNENGLVQNGYHQPVENGNNTTLDEERLRNGTTDTDRAVDKLESSTDTLTGDLTKSFSSSHKLSNGIDPESSKILASISTSTTDISDSHLKIDLNKKFCFNGQSLRINDLTLNLAPSNGVAGSEGVKQSRSCQTERRATSSKNSTTGSESSVSTPYNSQSSSCLNTPAADAKVSEPAFNCRCTLNHLSRLIDVDGLTLDVDPVQYRLHQKQVDAQQSKDMLDWMERHLQAARSALLQYALQSNGSKMNGETVDLCSLPESTGSGERMSLGQISNAASDLSWETVEEKDARMIRWVPDHAATHCSTCLQEFWIVRRRHHCRNCGRVFCASCADYFIAIPQQLMHDPVRVCRSCHRQLKLVQGPDSDPSLVEGPVFTDRADHLITAAEG